MGYELRHFFFGNFSLMGYELRHFFFGNFSLCQQRKIARRNISKKLILFILYCAEWHFP